LTTSIGAISCSVSGGGALGTVSDLSNGTYLIPFTPGSVNGTISCTVNGTQVMVTAQVISMTQTTISLSLASLPSQGTSTLVTVVPKDSNGNLIDSPNLTVALTFSGGLLSTCFPDSSTAYQAGGSYVGSLEYIANGTCSSGTQFTGLVQPTFNGLTFSVSQTLSVGP
jgi:hypothetical protein